MKKIMILYAKYGGGHQSAANALSSYIEQNYSDTQVKVVDCVEYVTPFLSKITTSAYKDMAKYTPNLWKKIYYGSSKGFWYKLSIFTKKYLSHYLLKAFKDFSPDIVISVHPFGSQITAYLKETGKVNCKLATVFTDFKTQPQWLIGKDYNDYFFATNDDMKNELLNLDIPEDKIFVTGVPLSNKFLNGIDINSVYDELNLNRSKKTILFFGGGEFGLGRNRTVEILRELTKYLFDYQIFAVSGKNKKMYNEFLNIQNELNNSDLHVCDYTNKVPELMSISSLVITKPGGLTSSESLASGLPILIINPIPGQEEENAEFLEKSGAGIWIKNLDDAPNVFNSILNNENKLNEMKNCAYKISHKYSTKDICNLLLK